MAKRPNILKLATKISRCAPIAVRQCKKALARRN